MKCVKNKAEMYRKLYRGDFGNTVPMWFDISKWYSDTMAIPYDGIEWWGIRSLTPGGPCKLNCHDSLVFPIACEYQRLGHKINISPMIDRLVTVTMWANVFRSDTGLVLECIENPDKGSNWRADMPTKAKSYSGITALLLLRKHLNADTFDDLLILLREYPDSVVELSATEQQFGTVPGRNAIIWEVRNY
jgi:hypothetical protein